MIGVDLEYQLRSRRDMFYHYKTAKFFRRGEFTPFWLPLLIETLKNAPRAAPILPTIKKRIKVKKNPSFLGVFCHSRINKLDLVGISDDFHRSEAPPN